MKQQEFAIVVTEIIRAEKDEFLRLIENEDWDGLHDELYECAVNCDVE